MPPKQPIEIFMPPNMLKAKVGGRIAAIDMAAVRRAEQALAELKTEFGNWINADIAKLVETRDRFAKTRSAETRDDLYRAGHDLRGQALTFGYPLVARMASSLCKLLDGQDIAVPLTLVDAHVDAIAAAVHQDIKEANNRTARALAEELDAQVREYLGNSKSKS